MSVASTWTCNRAVSLVHVRYQENDVLGYVLAWASLAPIFIGVGGFSSHFILRRELQAFFFALGIGLSEILNLLIKDLVKQARPTTCALLEMCDSHGWPSSHSQFMCFFSTYMMLLAVRRLSFSDKLSKWFCALVSWPLALLTMYSRIYLGYHSLEQVIAGAFLGTLMGVGWYLTVDRKIVRYFPRLEKTRICRYFLIKDSSHIPNVLLFEYNNSVKARGEHGGNEGHDSHHGHEGHASHTGHADHGERNEFKNE